MAEQGTSRRRFLGGAAAAAGVGLVGVGVAAGYGLRSASEPSTGSPQASMSAFESATSRAQAVVPFYGDRQAGITTPAQERLMFAALDVTTTDAGELQLLLGRWAAVAARLTAGKQVGRRSAEENQAPSDTGEIMDLGPHSLTITVGFGASLFDQRFGLAGRMPAELMPFGPLPGDEKMVPSLSDGDLCIQACADDPLVALHAVRNMIRAARGSAVLRWSQLGFGRASSTGAGQSTPRNLMGFKDGTNNIHADDNAALDEHVWVQRSAGQTATSWMTNGTYLVARKIRMDIEKWDAEPLDEQEKVFGRAKLSGAPLTGGGEFHPIDYTKTDDAGAPVIDGNAHVRLASPEQNGGLRLLRRGYNYIDGEDPNSGKLAAGLFFVGFQRDPHAQFKVIQTKLGTSDLLGEYVTNIGGGLWACPPGVGGQGEMFGDALFD
jgi:deferrochelatase/peroxidase EfeB